MEIFIPILLAIFFSALFSGLEMAYLSINKLHVELERQKGRLAYKSLGYLVDRPAPFIAAILVGNNVCLGVVRKLHAPLDGARLYELGGFGNTSSF